MFREKPSIAVYIIIGVMLGALIAQLSGNLLLGGIVLLGIIAVYFLPSREKGGVGGINRLTGNAYQQLVTKANGDKALADRLIKFEQKKNPDLSYEEAAEFALDRWNRDR